MRKARYIAGLEALPQDARAALKGAVAPSSSACPASPLSQGLPREVRDEGAGGPPDTGAIPARFGNLRCAVTPRSLRSEGSVGSSVEACRNLPLASAVAEERKSC